MRVWLAKDPKVVAIADYLARQRAFMDWLTDPVRETCNESAYEHVTRNVTVAVTVAALLQVWGAANESGKADGDDLVLHHATLESLDEICGVPGIGLALLYVEWASEEEPVRGKTLVRFRNFMSKNVPAEDRSRLFNAERQRRFREKKSNAESNVTHNVTVTHREEKRREDKKETTTAEVFVLPDWLPAEAWKAWLEVRKKNKAPNTPRALRLAVGELERLRSQGFDPGAVLDQSTLKGWKSVYPLKPELAVVSTEPKAALCDYCSAPSGGTVNGRRACDAHWQMAMDNVMPRTGVTQLHMRGVVAKPVAGTQ
jgi:hypothetical protein